MSGIGSDRMAALAVAMMLTAAAPAAAPKLGPPIPGRIVTIKSNFNMMPAGYVAEEHFLSGTAKSWRFVKARRGRRER